MRDKVVEIILETYSPVVVERNQQRLQDYQTELAHRKTELQDKQAAYTRIQEGIRALDGEPDKRVFLVSELEIRYYDIEQAKAKVASAERKVHEVVLFLARASEAKRIFKWR